MTTCDSKFDDMMDEYEALCAAGQTPVLEELCAGDARLAAKLRNAISQLDEFGRRYALSLSSIEGTQNKTLPWQSTNTPLPEQIGNYQVLGLLGQGGQGNVFLCRCQDPPAPVAIKVLGPKATSRLARERFVREKELLAKLRHPGIAQVFDAGMTDLGFGPTPYFVMEYIPGQRLNIYARDEAPSLEKRLGLLVKVSEAISHAHSQGVVHRDLKPGNILIDRWEQPKVIDFGIARVLDNAELAERHDMTIDQPGTLFYMTPEQLTPGMAIDCRSDVYALGVVAFELVTGELPYDVKLDRPWDFPQAIRDELPRPLWRIDRRLPRDLDAILQKALAKEPDRRYSTAGELAADIQRLLEKHPIVARPPSAWYRTRKFVERNRLLVGAVMAVIMALSLGLSGTLRGLRSAQIATEKARMAAADLALDRGDWQTALSHLGSPGDSASAFTTPTKAIRAALNVGEFSSAEKMLKELASRVANHNRGEYLLLSADFQLSKNGDLQQGETLAREALGVGGLSESDKWLAQGLCANNSLDAARYFEKATLADSRNYRAQLSLAVTRFFLGRHEELMVQTAAMDQLFSKEGAAQRLAQVSSVLQGFEIDSTRQNFSFLPGMGLTISVASLLDWSAATSVEPSEGKAMVEELFSALRLQLARKSFLQRFLPKSPKKTTPSRLIAASRHVPAIARAWSEFDEILTTYEELGHCPQDLFARMEAAATSHPEAMFLFSLGTLATELPLTGPEVATKLIRSEEAFSQAVEADAILDQVRIDARVQCVTAQYLLGTDHQTLKADPKMASMARENIRWLLANGKLPTKYATTFSHYALTLGDPKLAAEVAEWLSRKTPNDADARLLVSRARLESGEFPAAIRELDEVLRIKPNYAQAISLRQEVQARATAFVEQITAP